MSCKNPSYIICSKHGVYYFQLRLNIRLKKTLGTKSSFYRKSLRTKDRRIALKLARILWVNLYMTKSKKDKSISEPSEEEKQQIINDIYSESIYIRDAIEASKLLENFPNWDIAGKDITWNSLSQEQQYALQYVSDHDIKLSEYYDFDNNLYLNKSKTTSKNKTNESKIKLSEIFEKFMFDKETNNISISTKKAYREQVGLFIEALGDKQAMTVTRADVDFYKQALPKIPKNRNKYSQFIGKSIEELTKLNLQPGQRLSDTSLNLYVTKARTFLEWSIDNQYMNDGVNIPLKNVFKKVEKLSYDAFSDGDLEKLFYSENYLKGTHSKPSYYWVPILALYTGARLNEICQLHVKNIKQRNKIYFIEITDIGNDQRLKNESSKRNLPLHDDVIKLGFIEYVEYQRNKDRKRVFSELKHKSGKYSEAVSRWFGRYRQLCGVGLNNDENKTFHSFRDTFLNTLKQNGVTSDTLAELAGHRQGITIDIYTDPLNIETKYNAIKKLQSPIDLSKIRHWHYLKQL